MKKYLVGVIAVFLLSISSIVYAEVDLKKITIPKDGFKIPYTPLVGYNSGSNTWSLLKVKVLEDGQLMLDLGTLTATIGTLTVGDGMSGKSSVIFTSTSTVTNRQIIAGVAGKTLYLYGITFFNRGITKGQVNFSWDATGTLLCYPAYCPAESGFGDSDIYQVSGAGQGLYVTTPDACAITVYYLQK